MTSAEEDLMALALRAKPHTNSWLCLSPRVGTVRACTGSNQGDTHLSEKLVERKGVSRRQDVTVDARREHDVAR